MRRSSLGLLAAILFTSALSAQALPPPGIDGNRWSGSTALAQPQGFAQGAPINLTWGFMALGTTINDPFTSGFASGTNNLQTRMDAIYGAGTQATIWQPLFQSMFDRWSSISGVTYTFEPNDDGAGIVATGPTGQQFPTGISGTRPDLRIGGKTLDGNSGVLAYNYFPNVGDMVIDTNDNFFSTITNNSLRLRNVTAHEHGHGMGMSHVDPSTQKTLMEPFVSTAYDGPQFHDILVAQRAYGDALEKSFAGLGNDVVARASSLGSAFGLGGSRTIGNSPKVNMAANNNVVAFAATDFISIDSTTDTDFFSFTVTSPGRLTVLLEALGITYDARPQNNTNQFLFNALTRSDLKLALFDTNGTTLLSSVDATTFGGNEQIIFDLLAAGTYFVRVTGQDNPDATTLDTQFYALTVSLAAIPEPATVAFLGLVTLGTGGTWWHRRRQRLKELNAAVRNN